ncbi:Type 1 glutamine amidotransferase-like domain-containing protein [Microbacterium sp. EST19A]|uniref:Type 1 glutamine amidotransferase-like domain-containing protein n=1 Tax=Microbacterium sp. EST19A TaxID=2862681 RepID=UPI001CBDE9F3|nr:Type 1 glutamine amidotransferase-like domain-containing protein [Microbacterium sp. EST19A]
MKLLLTSGGVTNDSIRNELVELLGKPIEECTALIIPTAQWGHPMCSPFSAWRSVAGRWPERHDLVELGWESVGLLELTALPTVDRDRWEPWVREADVLLVEGGEAMYLAHWIRESGLERLLPELTDTVWVGVSGGSMALTPRIGAAFVDWRPEDGDETLGIVDFSIFPHLDYPGWESNTSESAREWGADIGGPAYAIDDQTAIAVVDGSVRVISEGNWFAIPGES